MKCCSTIIFSTNLQNQMIRKRNGCYVQNATHRIRFRLQRSSCKASAKCANVTLWLYSISISIFSSMIRTAHWLESSALNVINQTLATLSSSFTSLLHKIVDEKVKALKWSHSLCKLCQNCDITRSSSIPIHPSMWSNFTRVAGSLLCLKISSPLSQNL